MTNSENKTGLTGLEMGALLRLKQVLMMRFFSLKFDASKV